MTDKQGELVNIVKNYENNIDGLNDAIAIRYYEEIYEKNQYRRTSKGGRQNIYVPNFADNSRDSNELSNSKISDQSNDYDDGTSKIRSLQRR